MIILGFQTLAEIEPEKVDWFWFPYAPYGMITIVEGDPGLGKSILVTHLAAQTSVGGALPGQKIRRRRVVICSVEDDPALHHSPSARRNGS